MIESRMQRAVEDYQAGRLEPAAELLRSYLTSFPFDGPANHILGVVYYRLGKFSAARDHLTRACSAPGATPEMFNNYGAALKALGDSAGAMIAYRRALALDPDYPDALSNLGVIYLAQGNAPKAIELLRRAVALKPELTEAQLNLRNAYKDVVSPWHFAMINDRARNDAYRQAIIRAVAGKRVLDIGTGSGLLAMMAAAAGAAAVTSCESAPLIAGRARDIIALNGLSDRISVIAKHSTALVVGRDLADRAEVLITETFSSDLLGEGVLSAVEHAHAELLTPDAIVIPRLASARGYLAGGTEIEALLFAGRSCGFDLSPFNDFAPPVYAASVTHLAHDALSEEFEFFTFDLRNRHFPAASRPLEIAVTGTGMASVVVQWIHLDLDGVSCYENRPAADARPADHWTQILYRFPQPFAVKAGEVVRLDIGHARDQFWFDHHPTEKHAGLSPR